MLIYVSYKFSHAGAVYSTRFNVSLVKLTLITTLVMNVIGNNIALSLGMVGALSIVRFRTAIKEPVDTAFMFWGISGGIMAGAGFYIPAIVATLAIGVLYFGTYLMGFRVANRYLLVLKYKSSAHNEVLKKLKAVKKFKIRSKSIFGNEIELSLEVDIKENSKTRGNIETNVVDQFTGVDGVINASLIAYQNDFGA
jgi:uncharacterized membrane protein YhiD involved in acid resistance